MITTILKIDFDGHRFGPGKAQLLEFIAETGSISQAAKKMNMSYRRAWLLIDELNAMFDNTCVQTVSGGTGGGGAHVTEFGLQVVLVFRTIEAHTQILVAAEFKNLK